MNVLIIGLGSIAVKHINAIRLIKPSTIFYALRRSLDADQVNGVINVFSLSQVDLNSIDFIIVSNPTSEHYSTLNDLISTGVPLFIEKPLFDKVDHRTANLVYKINSNAKAITYVACNLRFLDSLRFLKEELSGQRINEVNAYCGSYLPDWRPNVDFRKVYSANKDQGGGVHIDLIHELDYIYWLFGSPKISNSYFRNSSSLDISSYDYANYTWGYEYFTANIILNYYRRDSKRSLEVLTDESTYNINLLTNSVYRNNEIVYTSKQRISDTYEVQLRFFIDKILSGKSKLNQVDEAYKILELCLD